MKYVQRETRWPNWTWDEERPEDRHHTPHWQIAAFCGLYGLMLGLILGGLLTK